MDEIMIEYYENGVRGCMCLNIKNCFPCNKITTEKKIFRLMRRWCRQEVLDEFKQELKSMLSNINQNTVMLARHWSDAHQARVDLDEIINSGKYPNGIPLTKDEYKGYKKERSETLLKERELHREAMKSLKLSDRLRKTIMLFEEIAEP